MNVPLLPNQLTPVLPLEVPPRAGSQLPPLPPTESTKQTDKFWHVTRHVFPAAYPRSRAGCYVARPVRENASAAGSKINREEIETQVAAMKTRQDTAPLQGQAEGGHLWIAGNCYRRKLQQPSERTGSTRRRPAITLILVHATGLHKETWEATLNRLADGSGAAVYEVWSLDIVNQGDSAILNAEHLGPSFDWMDVARDIANFMLQYLPEYTEQAVGEPYTTELPCLRVPSPDWLCLQAPNTRKPYTGGPWRGRHIISVGHSIGAASSVSACSLLPAGLVNGLVLFDPTVQPLNLGAVDRVMPLVYGALMRRDSWKTKQEALDGFAKKKQFFGRWNAEALASYAENGLYEMSSKLVTLKARKHDEAVTFLDPNLRGARACWNRLKHLPPSLRVHVILADPAESVIQSRGITPERLLHEMGQVAPTYQQLYGIHHMIVQEAPDVAAAALAKCVKSWLSLPSAHL